MCKQQLKKNSFSEKILPYVLALVGIGSLLVSMTQAITLQNDQRNNLATQLTNTAFELTNVSSELALSENGKITFNEYSIILNEYISKLETSIKAIKFSGYRSKKEEELLNFIKEFICFAEPYARAGAAIEPKYGKEIITVIDDREVVCSILTLDPPSPFYGIPYSQDLTTMRFSHEDKPGVTFAVSSDSNKMCASTGGAHMVSIKINSNNTIRFSSFPGFSIWNSGDTYTCSGTITVTPSDGTANVTIPYTVTVHYDEFGG